MRSTLLLTFILALGLSFSSSAFGQPAGEAAIKDIRFLPLTKIEVDALNDDSGKLHDLHLPLTPYNTARPHVPRRVETFGDRKEYLSDDPVGQFLVYFIGQDSSAPGAGLKIEVVSDKGSVAASQTVTPLTSPKVAFLLETGKLAPGSYSLRATLINVPGARKIPEYTFTKSDKKHDHVIEFPAEGVPLIVHEQAHEPDGVWPITTGVPLPRHAADSTDRFQLTENGKPVAAQWTTRATWYPGGPDGSELKWMGLDFLARYDKGKPREYRVIRLPQGQKATSIDSPLKVTEDDNQITVNTGAVRFSVSKHRFAGIDKAWLINADGSPGSQLIDGASAGGPFLMEERNFLYKASNDIHASVTVEESGPVRVTIYATGWYVSDRDEKCCLFQTRLSAYAGLPDINIHHRTVITYDTDQKKLRLLGFQMPMQGGEKWAFGGDGKDFTGSLPGAPATSGTPGTPGTAAKPAGKGKQASPEVKAASVWLHQDRSDHFRIVEGDDKAISEGKHTDGWASLTLPDATVTLTARNLWQLFPKEIELSREGMTFHAWPRHGHVAFTDENSFGRGSIYKLHYAHQGEYLDLKFPQIYFDRLRELANYGVIEQQDINAATGNAEGTAITNDFRLHFSPKPDATEAPKLAALYQQNPHAITDPIYNGLTDVEGRFAGRDPKRFPELEYMFDTGYRGFTLSVDYLQDYGMWIWPDTHNNWNPISKAPELHRWWTNSHYQNVWEDTFLYFRSGIPWIGQWAADNTQHYMDIGMVNYHNPRRMLQGKLKGAGYHVKGFTPWGSPRYTERTGDDYVEVGAHFINPDAGMFRYLLFGDRTGLDLMLAWAKEYGVVTMPPERSRECVTALGEMLSYYVNTWDPQALLYIHDLVFDMDSRPWVEVPAFPVHPLFHDRWVIRYWELTRDTQVRDRILEWLKPDSWSNFPQIHALLFEWTGDKSFLTAILPEFTGLRHHIYDNPGDPLSSFGGKGLFFPTPSIGETYPYYMQALIDNGLTIPAESDANYALTAEVTHPKKDAPPAFWFVLNKGVSYPGMHRGYVRAEGPNPSVTLTFTTSAAPYENGVSPAYLRIEDASGKVLYENTLLAGSQRAKETIVLDGKSNPGPWKFYSSNRAYLSWTGPAQDITVAPTAEQARAGK